MKYTEQQKKAIETIDRNVCVSAGAGTGKTYVLVQRFIYLLQHTNAEVNEIAAITFTEKAAKEMRDRLRSACNQLMTKNPAVWQKHKQNLEHSRIGTIHGFCARILRENAFLADIDPRFRVLDEAESFTLLNKIVTKNIIKYLEANDKDIAFLLSAYGMRKLKLMLVELVNNRIDVNSCMTVFSHKNDTDICASWRSIQEQLQNEIWNDLIILPEWQNAFTLLRHYHGYNELCPLEQRRKSIISSKDLLLIYENCTKTGYKKKDWDESSLTAILKAISILRSLITPYIKYYNKTNDELDLETVHTNRRILNVFSKIKESYQDFKKHEGLVDFNDLIIFSKQLLQNNLSIRKYYQESIKYLLVDEYQDTDSHQQEIIFHLACNPNKSNVLADNKLFIVGDQKQSIYRFRGADVSVFTHTKKLIDKIGLNIDLNTSWRSKPEHLLFFNHFFGNLMQGKNDFQAQYSPLVSQRYIPASGPTEAAPQIDFIWVKNSDKVSADESRKLEAILIARRIKQIVTNENLVFDTDTKKGIENARKTEYGDIAILFRAMTNVGIYEQELRKHEIPYYIVSGSGFYGRQEIKDILNYLSVIDNTYNNIALAGVLRSPLVGIKDSTLFSLRKSNQPLWQTIQETDRNCNLPEETIYKLSCFRKDLTELRQIKNTVSTAQLIQKICRRTGYTAFLLAQYLGKQKAANVDKLINSARKFAQKGMFTLSDFIKYINEFVVNDVREGEAAISAEESNVVKLMSIHKAKGLEFPVVVIPDISRRQVKDWGPLLYDRNLPGLGIKIKDENGQLQTTTIRNWITYLTDKKNLAESKRLLYVAFTRVRDYLIVSGNPSMNNSQSWMDWILQHYNLDKPESRSHKLIPGVNVRITTDPPKAIKIGSKIPLIKKYHQEIKNLQPLPCANNAALIKRIEKQLQPITQYTNQKDFYSATDLSSHDQASQEITKRIQIDKNTITASELGTKTHEFLEQWDFDPKSIPQDINPDMKRFITNLLQNPIYKEITTAKQVINELPLTFTIKDKIFDGIIDKFYCDQSNAWTILDYKTDKITASEVTKRAAQYELQLGIYALGINKIKGIIPKQAVILFLSPNERHTIEITKEYLKEVEERILTEILKRENSPVGNIDK